MKRLDELALGSGSRTVVFRGHTSEDHRLMSTWQRYRTAIPAGAIPTEIDQILEQYTVGLEKLGLLNFNNENRFEALEHGRHHGVPTPCLDFSYSPYVALFFAFDGTGRTSGHPTNSVIYALDVTALASAEAKKRVRPGDSTKFASVHNEFLNCRSDFFDGGFRPNVLQFIPYPGKRNTRMQRQFGCFLYDSLDYKLLMLSDLEAYLDQLKEIPTVGVKSPDLILHKLLIPQHLVSQVFPRLELMSINGGNLFGDADGVARDVINSYNYNPKFSYLRDVRIPPPTLP